MPRPARVLLKPKPLAAEAVKPMRVNGYFLLLEGNRRRSPARRSEAFTHTSPDVAFAAARAGAFIGDSSADETMQEIAPTTANPFQLMP